MSENWKKVFENEGAIWVHDGNPSRPHALLTSGLHSDGFVNCTVVTQQPALLQRIMNEPGGLSDAFDPNQRVDWVVGSAMGAVTFAYAVALRLGARAAFTEKEGDLMKLSRFQINPDQKVLVVEDTISTGGSTLRTLEGVFQSGVPSENILPYIVCLVNRSGSNKLGRRELRALLSPDIHTWEAGECPLCKAGSIAVRPKSNWADLTSAL